MFPPHQKKFVDESTKLIKGQLVKMGVVISRPERLKDTLLQIGILYHELKKEEEV